MQENSAFFSLKSRLYPHSRTKYFTSDSLFKDLQSLLIVPDVYPNNVNHILTLFESLTIEEKLQIQKSIGTIEYKKYEVTVST